MITVSIVSHGHGEMISDVVKDIIENKFVSKIIVTLNLYENLFLPDDKRIVVLKNLRPKGFSSNHNQAFALCETDFFCVVNPDIRLGSDVTGILVEAMSSDEVAIAAPLVTDEHGSVEDSARPFPTPWRLLRKLMTGRKDGYQLSRTQKAFEPDWVAGMFLLFRSDAFRKVSGFDEGYFLYYEDVDICRRMRRLGYRIVVRTDAAVIHEAQRASWKNWDYFRLHVKSMVRYFAGGIFRARY